MEDTIFHKAEKNVDLALHVWSKNPNIINNEFYVNEELINIGYFGDTITANHVMEIELKQGQELKVTPVTINALKFKLEIK